MSARRFWLLKNARADVDQTAEWTGPHEPEPLLAPDPGRRLRGDQSYASLHLGRGTKWIKPGSARQ